MVGRKGSHVRMKLSTTPRNLVVIIPDHKELAQGTLRSILRQAGISFKEFIASREK
ncbi:MAG: type II toxin-antitoxin system HicA family toxin [Candidatus Thorarchaeota archaeon]